MLRSGLPGWERTLTPVNACRVRVCDIGSRVLVPTCARRVEDGMEVYFTMPDFVEQGDELGEIALLVIRARRRWRELKGVGG